MVLMSQSEFAKRVGISQPAVAKLIKQGKLTVEGKKLVMPKAEQDYHLLKGGLQLSSPVVDALESLPPQLTDDELINDPRLDLQIAKIVKERYLGKLHRQKYNQQKGELLSIAELSSAVTGVCVIIRNELINLPNKISKQLEGCSAAEIQLRLTDEINNILTNLYTLREKYEQETDNNQST